MKCIKRARSWRPILGTQTVLWPLTPCPPPPPQYIINQPLSNGLTAVRRHSAPHTRRLPFTGNGKKDGIPEDSPEPTRAHPGSGVQGLSLAVQWALPPDRSSYRLRALD